MSDSKDDFGSGLSIAIDDDKITYRQNKFVEPETIRWNNIRIIYVMPYEVQFLLANETTQGLLLDSVSAENSLKIKDSIQKMARDKAIGLVMSTKTQRKD